MPNPYSAIVKPLKALRLRLPNAKPAGYGWGKSRTVSHLRKSRNYLIPQNNVRTKPLAHVRRPHVGLD